MSTLSLGRMKNFALESLFYPSEHKCTIIIQEVSINLASSQEQQVVL